MVQQPVDRNKLAREKRDMARRARRLAQTQMLDTDRERLTQFAADLERQAEALEQLNSPVSLPPIAAPAPRDHQPQQRSAEASAHPDLPGEGR
jgi:hypothetical protein